jgi:hypothetical protein
MGTSMVKLFYHSLFSIAYVVIRIFVMDAAASPAHGNMSPGLNMSCRTIPPAQPRHLPAVSMD